MDQESKTTAIVEFDPIKRTLQEFRAKYGDRQFDVSTPDGFAEAKSVAKDGRKALILLEKIRKARKERALRRCQQVDGEARELKEGIGAIFDPIFRQVDAEERRQEQEQREAARLEALRVAQIRERMEQLDPAIPFGATSAQIVGILNYVRATPVDDRFAEFEDDAYFVRVASLDRLQAALATVQAQEAAEAEAAAALAAERAESARLRAVVEAQEQATAAAAAAAAAAPAAGQLFPVEHSMMPDEMRTAAFCRSCMRPIPPAATDCACGWSMLPAEPAAGAGRPPLSASMRDRMGAFDGLADRLRAQAAANADPDAAAAALDAAIRIESTAIIGRYGDGESWIPTQFATPELNAAAREAMADYGAEAKEVWTDDGAAPANRPAPVTADFFDDRANDAVRICGIVYSGDFFRTMADAPVGCWFRVIARDGGRVDCFRAPPDCEADFDLAAGIATEDGSE
jgi:hypothetical protein